MATSHGVLVHFLHGGDRIVAVDEPPVKGAPLEATDEQGAWFITDVKIREDENAAGEYQFEVWVAPQRWRG